MTNHSIKIDKDAIISAGNLFTSGYSLAVPTAVALKKRRQAMPKSQRNPGIWQDGLVIWIDYNQNNVLGVGRWNGILSLDLYISSVTIQQPLLKEKTSRRSRPMMYSDDPCSEEHRRRMVYSKIEEHVVKLLRTKQRHCPL
jgi:hypothetical protein